MKVRDFTISIFSVTLLVNNTLAQEPQAEVAGSSVWLLSLLGAMVLVAASAFWFRSKDSSASKDAKAKKGSAKNAAGQESENNIKNSLEGNKATRNPATRTKPLPAAYQHSSPMPYGAGSAAEEIVLKQLNEQPKFSRLPISTFNSIKTTKPYDELPYSADEDLKVAIEETLDESRDDTDMRELSLRILAAYKTSNSANALSQIALYDLSSHLRSKAVSALVDFDHESVFDAIILASSDPTREVRAAAAIGMFKLSFDRAEAWARIIEDGDTARMRQIARAAMEAGFVGQSFERLTHTDRNISYEAFTLIALIIYAGDTDMIFSALAKNKEKNVKLALLQALKVVGEETSIMRLQSMIENGELDADVNEKAVEITDRFAVTVS